jgi:hypothetical protein
MLRFTHNCVFNPKTLSNVRYFKDGSISSDSLLYSDLVGFGQELKIKDQVIKILDWLSNRKKLITEKIKIKRGFFLWTT